MRKWIILAVLVGVAPSIYAANGDWTQEKFMEMQQKQAETKGRTFDEAKALKMFQHVDANNDGIATKVEKKAYYAKNSIKKRPKKGTKPATTPIAIPTTKLNKGDNNLEMFLEMREKKDAAKGKEFSREGALKLFKATDANGDGIITKAEQQAYWKK